LDCFTPQMDRTECNGVDFALTWLVVPKEKLFELAQLTKVDFSSQITLLGDGRHCRPCSVPCSEKVFYDPWRALFGVAAPFQLSEEDGRIALLKFGNVVFHLPNSIRSADGTMCCPVALQPSVLNGQLGLERIRRFCKAYIATYGKLICQNLIKAAAKIRGTDDLSAQSLACYCRSYPFMFPFMIVDRCLLPS